MTKKEKEIIYAFKEIQRYDWLDKYTKMSRKYYGNNEAWNKNYKQLLKRWKKKWLDIFNTAWGEEI